MVETHIRAHTRPRIGSRVVGENQLAESREDPLAKDTRLAAATSAIVRNACSLHLSVRKK